MKGPEQGFYPLQMHDRVPANGWHKWQFEAGKGRIITAWNREDRPPVNLPFVRMERIAR